MFRNPDLEPLSVRLPTLQSTTDLEFIAAQTISSLIPIALSLVFQRLFVSGGPTWSIQSLASVASPRTHVT